MADPLMTTTFPVLDPKRGGGITGTLDALNRIIDIAIPAAKQEGGTYVIPGHGRLSDEADVVEYRDMLTIVRDRVADLLRKGRTIQQVKDAGPAIDYDRRYGGRGDRSTSDQFIEAVYDELRIRR